MCGCHGMLVARSGPNGTGGLAPPCEERGGLRYRNCPRKGGTAVVRRRGHANLLSASLLPKQNLLRGSSASGVAARWGRGWGVLPPGRLSVSPEAQSPQIVGLSPLQASTPRASPGPRSPEEGARPALGRSRPHFRGMHPLPRPPRSRSLRPSAPGLTTRRGRAVPRGAALAEAGIK